MTSLSLSVVVIFLALTDLFQSRFVYHLKRRRWPRKLVKIHFCLFVWLLCPKQQKTRPIEKYDGNTFVHIMVQPSATRKGQDLPSATDGNLCLEKVAIRQACLSHCYLLDKLRNNETVQTEDGLVCFLLIWGNRCQYVDTAKGMDDECQFLLLAMYRVNCVKSLVIDSFSFVKCRAGR